MHTKTPARTIMTCAFAFCGMVTAIAQTGYMPPNPISPPVVAPPVMSPQSGLTLPEVLPPVISGPETADPAEAKKNNNGTLKQNAKGVAAAGKNGMQASGNTAAGSVASENPSLSATAFSLMNALGGSGGENGGMDALSGLLGGKTGSTGSTDSVTTQKILELLEKQQAQLDAMQKNTSAAAVEKPVEKGIAGKTHVSTGAELVRFVLNGYDIASTITALDSSSIARDGAFLLTGNRMFVSSGYRYAETFYLLCKKNRDGRYQLYADVSQNPVNENSFLYRLARKSPLSGSLTGDLLVFRISDPEWMLDLVIRVISPTVQQPSVR